LPSTSELYTTKLPLTVGTTTKALDIEQKAAFGQKKLALNKSKNFLLSRANIFFSTDTVTVLSADFLRTN